MNPGIVNHTKQECVDPYTHTHTYTTLTERKGGRRRGICSYNLGKIVPKCGILI